MNCQVKKKRHKSGFCLRHLKYGILVLSLIVFHGKSASVGSLHPVNRVILSQKKKIITIFENLLSS